MSDSLISKNNFQTVVAVSFVVALMALALSVVSYRRTTVVAAAVASFEIGDAQDEAVTKKAMDAQVAALEARIAKLESAPAAAPVPAAAAGSQ